VSLLRIRKLHVTSSAEPWSLASATPGLEFEATFFIEWRQTSRCRLNLEELVRHDLAQDAAETAKRYEVTAVRAAQDAVNAVLGATVRARRAHYRRIRARVTLAVSSETQDILAQRKHDDERVRRLRFLRDQLYGDPALYAIERIESHGGLISKQDVADIQQLARWLRAGDQWWYPILKQWEEVGQGFTEVEQQARAMKSLLDALEAFHPGQPPDPRPEVATSTRRIDQIRPG
jgi:hypothetical protein